MFGKSGDFATLGFKILKIRDYEFKKKNLCFKTLISFKKLISINLINVLLFL